MKMKKESKDSSLREERERERKRKKEKGIIRNGKLPYNYTIIMIIF